MSGIKPCVELPEILKCHQCDCLTAPYCTIGGELCRECFDYSHFQHRDPRVKFPGTFLNFCTETRKCKQCSSSRAHVKEKGVKFYVERSAGDGDCMYTCISNAMDNIISVKDLRRVVSRRQTRAMYDAYMDLLADNCPEYQNLEHINSFDQFRHYIQQCGSEIGSEACMWGDENALYLLANEYGFTFVVFNEKGSIIQKIQPINSDTEIVYPRYILIRLNGGSKGHEHYDLLKFNDYTILTQDLWNYLIEKTT